jgi:exopolyphosphatase/guanosine-5'-triphosphate,3'-diphosphate pyrophosphatase
VDERFSVDVGAVRYTERFRTRPAVSPEVLREAMAAIAADLARASTGARFPTRWWRWAAR